jgi:DNA-binding Lrp family transcriptional regulator
MSCPEQDGISSNRHPALSFYLRMIFSENRYPLFRIMLLTRRGIASKFACHGPLNLALLPLKRGPSETTAMVPFFVQFKCKLGQSYAVANALAEAEIASEIYSTAGDYDLLVKFYVDNDTDIGHFVNEKVQVIPGIQDTHTIITFKAFGTG